MRLATRAARLALVLFPLLGTAQAQSVLNFPRVSLESDSFTGIAIANPGAQDATVELTLRGADGSVLTDAATISVPAGQQYAQITSAIFGEVQNSTPAAWLQATSATSDLTGFFLFLNPAVTFFDGADLPRADSRIAFNEVRLDSGYSTELNIVNPGSVATTVSLELLGGATPVNRQLQLAARGAARIDVSQFFGLGTSSTSTPAGQTGLEARYVVAQSDGPAIAGFALATAGKDVLGQNAVPVANPLNTLFFPQLAVLGSLESQLVVVNYGDEPAILTIFAHKPDGTLYDGVNLTLNPVARVVQPGAVLREDLASLFGFFGDESLQGWLEVQSSAQEINGSISYSIPAIGSVAAVSSVADGSKGAIFSHIATARGFFTGVAILNAASLVANYEIIALRPDGTLLGSYSSLLGPRQRVSMLIDEFIEATAGQAGGLILVRSDVPLYLTSLFGSEATGVLANIPPQPVPDTFQPATGQPTIAVSPPLAVVAPAGSQTFSSNGGTGTTWLVDGVEGGDTINGTVSATGRYTAPGLRPDIVPVAVAARNGNATAGASVDVVSAHALAQGLGVVQAVAYSGGLGRVFAAELQGLGALQTSDGTAPQGDSLSSSVYDVTSGSRVLVDQFEGQDIAKMLAFSSGGRNFLLLLDRAGGNVTRLNPENHVRATVLSGLDAPAAMTFDPSNGDLLVAESSQVTRIPRSAFAPSSTAAASVGTRVVAKFPAETGRLEGVAINRCDGSIYVSTGAPAQLGLGTKRTTKGGLWRVEPNSGRIFPMAQPGLPFGNLLSFYRKGLACPETFHLLAVDRVADRIVLIVPTMDLETTWAEGTGAVDLDLIPETVGVTIPQGELGDPSIVTIAGQQFDSGTGVTTGSVSLVEAPGLYTPGPVNPPPVFVDRSGVYDAVVDFSAEDNPAGTWSYGFESEAGAPFTPFEGPTVESLGSIPTPGGFHWFSEAGTVASASVSTSEVENPSLGGNLSGDTIVADTLQWPVERLLLHPGSGGLSPTLRWSAPEDGVYQVTAVFEPLDSGSADVFVVLDNQIEDSGQVRSGEQPLTVTFRRQLSAGSVLDFVVGAPNGSSPTDNVGLEVVIVKVGP